VRRDASVQRRRTDRHFGLLDGRDEDLVQLALVRLVVRLLLLRAAATEKRRGGARTR
jgi:hypothetical protein